MRLVLQVCGFVLFAFSTVAGADMATPPSAIPQPITTRQTVFAIPFQVDGADHPSREPAEVQLFVSTDRGANWQIYSRVKPEQRRFLFRAVTDGEYWFAIRTRDHSGQTRPERTEGPGLCVLVDTTLPQLEIHARQGEAGQVLLQWQVKEDHLAPDTFRVQYRSEPGGAWQPVAIDRQTIPPTGPTWTGEVIWWPDARSSTIEIRAEVADAAGNVAVSHAQVALKRVASTFGPADADPAGTRAQASQPRYAGDTRPAATALWPGQTAQPQDLPWRASADCAPPTWQGPAAGAALPQTPDRPDRAVAQSAPGESPKRPEQLSTVVTSASPAGVGQASPVLPRSTVAAGVNPPIRNQYVMPQESVGGGSSAGALAGEPGGVAGPSAPPSEEQPQMINSRLFELEYQADTVGPSGVGRVELWGTRDGGRTWSSFGLDQDRQSPMLVTVPEEGVYGFRVALQNGMGVGGEKPQSGDRPQVWIGVDLTKPAARILAAEPGTGAQTAHLVIRWEARDAMLAARPVSLFYSSTPNGPWREIATGLENTGAHAWSVRNQPPERVYLRLEVRDEAGNVGMDQTTEPVALDPYGPTGRITRVRPVIGRS